MTTSRPPLPDSLPAGTPVFVRRSSNDMRGRSASDRFIEAYVVSAARIWVTIQAVDGQRTWRMRRDTQDEATQYSGSNDSFLTEEQYRWARRDMDARQLLAEQGIRIDTGPWYDRHIDLADALRRGMQ